MVVLAATVAGCGKPPAPTLAGGKPVAHWVEAARGPDPRARKEAVFKLGNVGPADPTAFPAVTGALRDANPIVRREAILALLKFGPQAREAVPTLEELVHRDPDDRVRTSAAKALARLRDAPDGG
jgi:HEAT repeat protein